MDEKRQAITVRLPVTLYEWVRRQAYERHVTQQSIVETAVDDARRAQAGTAVVFVGAEVGR